MSCSFRLWALTLLLGSAGSALAEPPSLTWHDPAGGRRGKTVAVTMGFKADLESLRVWTDTEHLQVTVPNKVDGKFMVEVADDAAVGAHWIRLIDAQGVSEARQFMVGTLPEIVEEEPNGSYHSYDLVEESLPLTVNGKLGRRGDVDAFAWNLEVGEWLVASVDAHALDSPIDPMLRLVTAQGDQLAFAHDNDRGGLDPSLAFQAPAKGRYILLLSGFGYPPKADSRFTGGENVIYRLHAQNGPPSFDNAAYHDEEPNQTADSALPLAEDALRRGLLGDVEDEDWYRFIPTAKDQTYEVQVKAQVLGSKIDGWLEIRDGAGKVLASSDDSGRHTSPDPMLTWKAPSRDPHFVVVRDVRRYGGPRYHYQLLVNRANPRFDIIASEDRWTVFQGGSVEITMNVVRQHGHAEAITLEALGLPGGLTCAPVLVSSDQKQAILTIMANEDVEPQSWALQWTAGGQGARYSHKGTFADAGALFLNEHSKMWITVRSKEKAPTKQSRQGL